MLELFSGQISGSAGSSPVHTRLRCHSPAQGHAHHDGAGGVDHVAPRLGVGIYQVDGCQQQLLLQEGALPDLVLAFAGLRVERGHRVQDAVIALSCLSMLVTDAHPLTLAGPQLKGSFMQRMRRHVGAGGHPSVQRLHEHAHWQAGFMSLLLPTQPVLAHHKLFGIASPSHHVITGTSSM